MPKYPRIDSYPAALAALRDPPPGQSSLSHATAILRRDHSVSLRFGDGLDAHVTFYPDGRLRVATGGTNSHSVIEWINRVLPFPYKVRRPDGFAHVYLIDRREPDVALAQFLSSVVFTPERCDEQTTALPKPPKRDRGKLPCR